MAQEFSRRPVTAGHWFEPRLGCLEFVMGKVALEQVFLRVTRCTVSVVTSFIHHQH